MGWSAENATNAYLHTLKTDKMLTAEPNVAEFISAMAAGNCSSLMVDVCAGAAGPTTLALIAAAQQTGGHVVCIVPTLDDLAASETVLGGRRTAHVDLLVGDAVALLLHREAPDFLLVDCEGQDHEKVFVAAEALMVRGGHGGVVVGYNAMGGSMNTMNSSELLPIGDGLRVSRVLPAEKSRKSRWLVRVDEFTGEENVFRVAAAPLRRRKRVQA